MSLFEKLIQPAVPWVRCFPIMFILLVLLSGCASNRVTVSDDVKPIMAHTELPEDTLLNVAIQVFDPGKLPDDPDDRQGLSEEIRQAEANFIPVHLKYTLQRSGYWGSVWVVPDDNETADLVVGGSIEYSDGERLVLHVRAVDARGVVWLDKVYDEESTPSEHTHLSPEKLDTFQDLFNAISNDLVKFRLALTERDIEEIRQLQELRYAASMSPDPFSQYFTRDSDGRYRIVRLPAPGDPMLARIRAVRARDEMLMDTLSGYYDNYYLQLWKPYQDWRKFRAKELEAMRKVRGQAYTRGILGVAAIAGAIALGTVGGEDTSRALGPLRGIMAAGGAAAIYSGFKKMEELKMNREVIEELGQSFSADATPLVVEVNGETVRLTGTAKEQYRQWRALLREIYRKETGFDGELPVLLGPEDEHDENGSASGDASVSSGAEELTGNPAGPSPQDNGHESASEAPAS